LQVFPAGGLEEDAMWIYSEPWAGGGAEPLQLLAASASSDAVARASVRSIIDCLLLSEPTYI
jgi:hypothetical protein